MPIGALPTPKSCRSTSARRAGRVGEAQQPSSGLIQIARRVTKDDPAHRILQQLVDMHVVYHHRAHRVQPEGTEAEGSSGPGTHKDDLCIRRSLVPTVRNRLRRRPRQRPHGRVGKWGQRGVFPVDPGL